MTTTRAHLLTHLAASALLVLAAACDADGRTTATSPDPSGDADVPVPCTDRDGDGFGARCPNGYDCDDLDPTRAQSCDADPEPCEPGAREACWKMLGANADVLSCGVGTRVCTTEGLWGACEVDERFEKPVDSRAIINPVEPCNPCAPACARATDTPDDADLTTANSEDVEYDAGRGGIRIDDNTDDPSTLLIDTDGDGVPDDDDLDPLDPLVNGYTEFGNIYAVLPFNGPTVARTTDVEVQLRSADIYFLMDTTGSMQGEIDALRTSLTQGNFITAPERCGLPPTSGAAAITDWNATYWDNTTLSGAPAFTRVDPEIDFPAWPSPVDPGLDPTFDNQNFSVRWEKTVDVAATSDLVVNMRTDDGMRVRVDGAVVWDVGWRDQGATDYSMIQRLGVGTHTVAIEYYQGSGGATATATAFVTGPEVPGFEGIIGALSCQLRDPTFAVGYFDDYPIDRYGYSLGDGQCNDTVRGADHDLPFHQLIGRTPPADRALITAAVNKLSARCGDDGPESQLSALYAIATGAELPDTRQGKYVEPAPAVLVEGADPFRAPEPLVDVNMAGPNPPTLSWVDYDAGDITTTPKAFEGDTSLLGDRHDDGNCGADNGAPDVTFRFEVSADDTWLFFSTQGSSFDSTIHVYDDGGGLIRCDNDTSQGTHGVVRRQLDAGTYYVSVDGRYAGESGPFRLYMGPVQGNDATNALDLGDLTGRFVQLYGDTDPEDDQFTNFTGSYDCWGGDKNNAEDVVLRFQVSQPTNIVVNNAGTAINSFLQLRGSGFERIYCHNGGGNQASIFQRLDPGTYYVVFSGSSNNDGNFRLSIGSWGDPAANITPPGAPCADGIGGYGCIREGAVPIVVMFSDAEMHNGPGGYSRYSFGAPAYMDAVTALNRVGAKVIGIHSGGDPSTSCSTPCNEYDFYDDCRDVNVCTASETTTVCMDEPYCVSSSTVDDCWLQTYCAEYEYYDDCRLETFCQQGGICWDETVCRTRRRCIRTATRTRCRTRTVCDVWGTRSVCNDVTTCTAFETRTECTTRRGDCIDWGEPSCGTTYAESHEHQRRVARDTNTVDLDGEPFVYHINSDGTGLSQAVVQAIDELSGSFRMDISLRPNDNLATPSVDERDFVDSIATVSTGTPPPETLARCEGTEATFYRKCLPGTTAQFVIGFRNDIVPAATGDQYFTFEIQVLGEGVYVLGTIEVTIRVPERATTYDPEGRYWRDYDAQDHCAPDEAPRWGIFDWSVEEPMPLGSSITFEFRTAATQAGLDTAAPVSETIPGAAKPVDDIDALLEAAGEIRNHRWLRATAVLRAGTGLLSSPVLYTMETQFECAPID